MAADSALDDLDNIPGPVGDTARQDEAFPAGPTEMPSQTAARYAAADRQQAQIQRTTASKLAARDIPTYTDDGGNIQPIRDETGAALTNLDKAHRVAYDSSGNPVSWNMGATGAPTITHPLDAPPNFTDKKGNRYTTAPGLPWKWQGVDPDVEAQNQQTESEKAAAAFEAANGRQMTADEKILKGTDNARKAHAKALAAIPPVAALQTANPNAQPEDMQAAINQHFDAQKRAPALGGFFGGLSAEDQAANDANEQARADALARVQKIQDLSARKAALGQKIDAEQQLAARVAQQRLDAATARMQAADPDFLSQSTQNQPVSGTQPDNTTENPSQSPATAAPAAAQTAPVAAPNTAVVAPDQSVTAPQTAAAASTPQPATPPAPGAPAPAGPDNGASFGRNAQSVAATDLYGSGQAAAENLARIASVVPGTFGDIASGMATDLKQRRRWNQELQTGQYSPDNPFVNGGREAMSTGVNASDINPALKDSISSGLGHAAAQVPFIALGAPGFVLKAASDGATEAGDKGDNRIGGALKGAAIASIEMAAFGGANKIAERLIPATMVDPVRRFLLSTAIAGSANFAVDGAINMIHGWMDGQPGNFFPQTWSELVQRGVQDFGFGAHHASEQLGLPKRIEMAQAQSKVNDALSSAIIDQHIATGTDPIEDPRLRSLQRADRQNDEFLDQHAELAKNINLDHPNKLEQQGMTPEQAHSTLQQHGFSDDQIAQITRQASAAPEQPAAAPESTPEAPEPSPNEAPVESQPQPLNPNDANAPRESAPQPTIPIPEGQGQEENAGGTPPDAASQVEQPPRDGALHGEHAGETDAGRQQRGTAERPRSAVSAGGREQPAAQSEPNPEADQGVTPAEQSGSGGEGRGAGGGREQRLQGVDEAAHEAAPSPRNDLPEPTAGQKEAGNYQKGHIKVSGLDISVENPAGSERKGVSKEGKPWSVKVGTHYGYIRGTEGRDGDHVDALVKPGTPEDWKGDVYVVNQRDTSGKFDEHKAVIGAGSQEEARALYRSNYEPGWHGGETANGGLARMTMPDFKDWLKNGDQTRPAKSTVALDAKTEQNPEHASPEHSADQAVARSEERHSKEDSGANAPEEVPGSGGVAGRGAARPGEGLGASSPEDVAAAIESAQREHKATTDHTGIRYSDEKGPDSGAGLRITPDGEIIVNKDRLHDRAAVVERLGGNPLKWIRSAHDEEISHGVFSALWNAREKGKEIWDSLDAATQRLVEKAYMQPIGADWKKGAEYFRMLDQIRRTGEITEQHIGNRDTEELVESLKEQQPKNIEAALSALHVYMGGNDRFTSRMKEIDDLKNSRPSEGDTDASEATQDGEQGKLSAAKPETTAKWEEEDAPYRRSHMEALDHLIRSAHADASEDTGFKAVPIERLARESGVPLDQARAFLAHEERSGRAVLSEGDWSLASPQEKAAAIESGGKRKILARFNDVEKPASEAPNETVARLLAKSHVSPEEVRAQRAKELGAATPESSPTGIKNAETDLRRKALGMSPAYEVGRRSFPRVWDEATHALDQDPMRADRLAKELLSKPRPISDLEDAILLQRQIRLQTEHRMAQEAQTHAYDSGDAAALGEATVREAKAYDDLWNHYDATNSAGTENARGLNARKMMAHEDYSLARMISRARSAVGGAKLSKEQSDFVKQQAKEIEKRTEDLDLRQKQLEDREKTVAQNEEAARLSKEADTKRMENPPKPKQPESIDNKKPAAKPKLSDLEKKNAPNRKLLSDLLSGVLKASTPEGDAPEPTEEERNAAKITDALASVGAEHIVKGTKDFTEWSNALKSEYGDKIEPHLKDAFEKAKEIAKGFEDDRTPMEKTAAKMKDRVDEGQPLGSLRSYLGRMAREIVESGEREGDKIVDRLHDYVKEFLPEVSRSEVRDAWLGYGDYKAPSKVATEVAYQQARGEQREAAKQEDILKGQAPKASGVGRPMPEDKWRRLAKDTREMLKRSGIKATDPERQLKTTLDTIKTRLKNQIRDLSNQIDTGEKPVKRPGVVYDDQAERLRDLRDRVQKTLHNIEGKPEASDEERIKQTMKALQDSMKDYADRLNRNDYATREGRKPMSTPEIEAMRARRDAAREEWLELRQLDEDFQRKESVRKQQAVQKQIDAISEKLQSGDLSSKSKSAKPEDDVKVEGLKSERDALTRKLLEMRREANAPSEAELEARKGAAALKAWKTRAAQRIADLKQRIADNNFEPRPKPSKVHLDPEAQKMQTELERQKLDYERKMTKWRQERRTLTEKALDGVAKWSRAFVLSGPTTLLKLSSAAGEILGLSPVEEAVGEVLRHLPVVRDIAAKAPRHGSGLNVGIEAKAIAQTFLKFGGDFMHELKTGHMDIDEKYGGKKARVMAPPELKDYIAHVHGALKAPARRQEFVRSYEKRLVAAGKAGEDITDPMIQMKHSLQAYQDAQKAIFSHSNDFVEKINRFINSLGQPGKDGKVNTGMKALQTGARVALPVLKIPINIASRTLEYSLGSLLGLGKVARYAVKGFEGIKPEEQQAAAESITSNLKRGSVGLAVMSLGYFNPNMFGGYYQKNEKRDENDAQAGGVKIGGMNIPRFLVHNPLLEQAQIGATIRRVAESKISKKDMRSRGTAEGIWAALTGVAQEIPFVKEAADIDKLQEAHNRSDVAANLAATHLVPQGLQQLARSPTAGAISDKLIPPAGGIPTATKRAPKGIVQEMANLIPFARRSVPVAQPKKSKGSVLDGAFSP